MENIDTMFLDTHQRGFNSIPFTTWGSYGESIDIAKKALYNQKEVRLHSVCARYDSISYSHMGAGRVNISAYLCTYQNTKPSDTDSFFILLESSWMHLDKLIQALKEILDEELPECLVKDIMKISEDRM